MRVAALVVLLTGCATATPTAEAPLSACDLEHETACVTYGGQVAGAPTRPSAQLAIGLADRAAQLPDEEAVDYWRRIEEIISAAKDPDDVTARRAAAAYANLAVLAADEIVSHADNLEAAFADGQDALERVRSLGEFAVRWGDATVQARAARAIADGYGHQAANLQVLQIPSEVTVSARATLERKRDEIVEALQTERRILLEGVAEHCRKHRLTIPACSE